MAFNVADFLTETEKITKILAIVLAGGWAYYHYFRGRTYRPRLEPSVSAQITASDKADLVVVTVQLKNVGLSRVVIEEKGTALVVSTCDDVISPLTRTEWSAKGAFPVFEHHGWIEPNETIQDKILFGVPQDQIAVLLELRIRAAGIEWDAEDVVIRPKCDTNNRAQMGV